MLAKRWEPRKIIAHGFELHNRRAVIIFFTWRIGSVGFIMGDGHALTRKRQIEKFKIAVFLPQAVGATKQTFMAFKPDVPVQFVARNQLHLDFGQYTKAAQRDPRTFQHIVILPVADFQIFATARDHAQASDFRRQGGQGAPSTMGGGADCSGQCLHINITKIPKGQPLCRQQW